MSFAVEDFPSLLRLLREHPEWRAELRRDLLGEELLSLPDLVAENTRAIAALGVQTAANTRAIAELGVQTAANTRAIAELGVQTAANTRAIAELRVQTAENTRAIAELRESIVELREQTEANTRAIAELRESIAELREQTEANTQAIAELREAVSDLRSAFEDYARVSNRRFDTQQDDLGALKGMALEEHFSRQCHRIMQGLRKPRRINSDELDDLLDAASLSGAEEDTIRLIDIILRGRQGRGDDAQDVRVAVEVSNIIDLHDVQRVMHNREVLEKLGLPALAAVAGQEISPAAADLARSEGVTVALRQATKR